MQRFLLIILIIGLSFSHVFSQRVEFPLVVSDDSGNSIRLLFGIDPSATNGINESLGEYELPPFPPLGVFEARFLGTDISIPELGLGTYRDIRLGGIDFEGTHVHQLQFQIGSENSIILDWDLPEGVSGLLQDMITGSLINIQMLGKGDIRINNAGSFSKLKITITYALSITKPEIPILDYPQNGAKGLPVNLSLFWGQTLFAESYELQVSKNNSFTELVANQAQIIDTTYVLNGLDKESSYFWRIRASNSAGTSEWSDVWSFTTQSGSAVSGDNINVPLNARLEQNYPNPFNGSTKIEYSITKQEYVKIDIIDVNGRIVNTISSGYQSPGMFQLVYSPHEIPSGSYFIRLVAGQESMIKRMIYLK